MDAAPVILAVVGGVITVVLAFALNNLVNTIGKRLDDLRDDLGKRIDTVGGTLSKRIDDLGGRVTEIGVSVTGIQHDISELKVTTARIDERLKVIEGRTTT